LENGLAVPSALETLVKILKLEREQGCKNTAVIGGLGAFSEKWGREAHGQARKPEHHYLVDELTNLLRNYDQLGDKNARTQSITYMLDRIMGRVKPPEGAVPAQTPNPEAEAPPEAAPPSEPPRRERPQREMRDNREQRERPQRQDRQQSNPPSHEPAPERPMRDAQAEPRRERPPQQKQPPQKQRPVRQQRQGPRYQDDDRGGDEFRQLSGPDFASLDAEFESNYRSEGRARAAAPDIPPRPSLARAPRRARPPISLEAAAAAMRELSQPVTAIKGVGPKRAQELAEAGIRTVNDLLFYEPRRHDDYTNMRYISRLRPNTVATVVGTVQRTSIQIGRGQRRDFYMEVDDGTAGLRVVFFGQHFLIRTIRQGNQVVLSGDVSAYSGRLQMTNPDWEFLDTENLHTVGIVPVYPLRGDLKQRALRQQIRDAVNQFADKVPDYVPEGVLERCEMSDLGWAIRNLHFPEGMDHLHHAKNRLIFDELLLLQLAILRNRREWQSHAAPALDVRDDFLEPFIEAVFPYPLTGAQRRAIEDVRRDVTTSRPMNRLLQGDVGAGKTAVATAVLGMAFANGKQGALMAPTSILAEQHYRNISRTLANTPPLHMPDGERIPVVGLLTSSLSSGEREGIYSGLADGSIDIVVGTHALIQEGVEFNDLAVAIVDEQHRFGVEQRKALRSKGGNPHLLVMTATPIPRTLALTLYADLDLSILDEMPPGRKPVQTRILPPLKRETIYDFIKAQIDQGRQAFFVHPLVEESESVEARAAVQAYQELRDIFFRYKVGLLHGRMKPAEKDEVMHAFATRQFDVLVTTSVAEVGVDIPNASVMVIENADRFGLAQLHQFRGRVGRGEHESFCLLISENAEDERLKAMEFTTDGFLLAEIDWKLRGAGDLLGMSQSGGSSFGVNSRFSHLMEEMTPDQVALAQREARTIYEEDPDLAHPEHALLAQRVVQLFDERSDVS
jgi:ATP-dependent DNA helicase RecG